MRFPLTWAYTALDCLLCRSCISEAELKTSLSLYFSSSSVLKQQSRSHWYWLCYVVVWKGHLILYLIHFEWTIRTLPQTVWTSERFHEDKLRQKIWICIPKMAQAEGYSVCCFRELKVIYFIVHGYFLFWAMMWRDQTPAVWTCPSDMYLILCPISYCYPKCHVDFRGLVICICSPSFITKI